MSPRVGQARRRDVNEQGIVEALEAAGCDVLRLSGKGAPDLLVRRCGQLWAFEVKSEKGTRTEAQEQTQWTIVRTPREALAQVGITISGGLQGKW